ncbi:hypothetical protein [Xanthobacter sp. YC-JY1]|uniref:hypothetical protein n=1 Tax=Xanthobacter sp. YC-JY1 TaxID=2419844 RepID=UPI001F1B7E48|nr:hypothetical protein [Xanthobacter sp. YC-JY1]UJX45765.1 hypothetical protein D7006_14320 [Xanthobacter sp. YC-JY1]
MCLGGGSKPATVEPVAAPPAPPGDKPTSPAFNEATTTAKNANSAADGARRGRSALRIDLNSPTSGSGLTIQQ